jgi:thiol-disulfide isomerase/thioredoxin
MRKFVFLAFAFYTLLSTACRPAAAPVSIGNKPVSINDIPVTNQPMPPGKPIEEMSWRTFDGKSLTIGNDQKLKDFQGKVVILDFWATYCPPCIEGIPYLRQLQAKHGKENLEIIGLHVGDEEDFRKIPEFVEKLKIDYPLATPENELTRFIFGKETAIPQTAIFDRQGKMIKKFVGFNEQIKKDLDETVQKAIVQ